jgi:hypothetical protein
MCTLFGGEELLMTRPLLSDRARVVASLAEQLRELEGTRFDAQAGAGEVVSTGLPGLDRMLPERGLHRGTLVEWLSEVGHSQSGWGSGAGTLALLAAREALAMGGVLVVIDRARRFYPPAALGLGVPLERMILVRPGTATDEAWALDQVLRSRGVAALWCPLEQAGEHAQRRWHLAAETSGVLGLLVRGPQARSEPSWAELRLGVRPLVQPSSHRARRLCVEILRSRWGAVGEAVEVDLPERIPSDEWQGGRRGADHEADAVSVASSVAFAADRRHSRRA